MPEKEYNLNVIVEFEDVDSYNIVHHTKLIAYLERARVHFFKEIGIEFFNNEYLAVLYNLEVQFKKSAKLLDNLIVSLKTQSLESYRLILAYTIKRDDDIICKATTELVFIDSKDGNVIPVPEICAKKINQLKNVI